MYSIQAPLMTTAKPNAWQLAKCRHTRRDAWHVLTLLSSAMLLFSASVSPASAFQDDAWPQFRGPNRDGVSSATGLMTDWTTAPEQNWKASGLGIGFSSIAIQDGISYTTGDREDGAYVIANNLDEAGKAVWATRTGSAYDLESGYDGARCTPTISDGRLYVVGFRGDLHCLDCKTGEIVWSIDYQKDLGVGKCPDWGFSESVLIDGDNVICTPGGLNKMVVAIDKVKGTLKWELNLASELENLGLEQSEFSVKAAFSQETQGTWTMGALRMERKSPKKNQ